jgi:hypothetical protein
MKDKNKKRWMWAMGITIIVLAIIIVILLLRHQAGVSDDSGTCINTVNAGGGNNYGFYDGTCSDGGTYHCTVTCTSRPPLIARTTDTTPSLPNDGTTCRNYASDRKYLVSTWDSSLDTLAGCQNYALNHGCSAPSTITIVNHCCMYTC